MATRIRLAALALARSTTSSSSSSSSASSNNEDDEDVESGFGGGGGDEEVEEQTSGVEVEGDPKPSIFTRLLNSARSAASEDDNNSSSSSNSSSTFAPVPYATAGDEGEGHYKEASFSSSSESNDEDDNDEESQLSSLTLDPLLETTVEVKARRNGDKESPIDSTTHHLRFENFTTLTAKSILENGLIYAGFGLERQQKNNLDRKIVWFKSFYGVEPSTLLPFFTDLKDEYPDIHYKDCLMTMNWLFLYDTYPVLSGRWKRSEEYIGAKLIEYGKKMAIIGRRKVVFELKDDVEIGRTVDCSTFMIYEMRTDPSSKWFDWKTHSCGLKYSLAIYEPRVVWVNGPVIPSMHDITLFRGGTTEQDVSDRDHTALYFQVKDGEKFVADSGYAGEPDKIVMTRDEQTPEFKEFLARCKNRGETFHWRLKAFNILGGRFRHGTSVENRMELHRMAVDVVVGVIQYDYENGHPPFDVR